MTAALRQTLVAVAGFADEIDDAVAVAPAVSRWGRRWEPAASR